MWSQHPQCATHFPMLSLGLGLDAMRLSGADSGAVGGQGDDSELVLDYASASHRRCYPGVCVPVSLPVADATPVYVLPDSLPVADATLVAVLPGSLPDAVATPISVLPVSLSDAVAISVSVLPILQGAVALVAAPIPVSALSPSSVAVLPVVGWDRLRG